jgi:hypothetical protein
LDVLRRRFNKLSTIFTPFLSLKSSAFIPCSSENLALTCRIFFGFFRATFNEEVRPYSETITEKLKDLRQMRTDNDYYIRDIHNSVERVIRHYM